MEGTLKVEYTEIAYTDAQRLTIALAELASALGVQLTRNDAINPDWRLVDRLTAHVREQRGIAQRGLEWPTVCGLPGTAQGDMALLSYTLRGCDRAVHGDVVEAFNRTLERVERGARNEAYQLNQAARKISDTRAQDAAPPPTGEAFLELVGRVAALEAKARP